MDVIFPLYNRQKPVTNLSAMSEARIRRPRGGIEARQRQRQILRYVLLFVSAAFMMNALIGENGYLETVKARRQHRAATRALVDLRLDNARLREEAQRLKSDPTAIEEAARKDLGLIRPGETLVIVKDAPPRK
jgi:cell division protein FtsB